MDTTITAVMTAAAAGAPGASQGLFSALYSELHRLARRELRRGGGAGISLGATTLLHEAYIHIGSSSGAAFPDRCRFMGYAAKVMRGLIIDHARSQRAQKRGGQFVITVLADEQGGNDLAKYRELRQIGDALEQLGKVDRDLAEIVDLRFFCGFSFSDIAGMRGVSERTVQRGWEKARIYLHGAMANDPGH